MWKRLLRRRPASPPRSARPAAVAGRRKWEPALAAEGVTAAELDRSPGVDVEATHDAVRLCGWVPSRVGREPADTGTDVTLDAPSDEELGRSARAFLRSLAAPAQLPEGPTGVPFGFKTAWLAVRAGDSGESSMNWGSFRRARPRGTPACSSRTMIRTASSFRL